MNKQFSAVERDTRLWSPKCMSGPWLKLLRTLSKKSLMNLANSLEHFVASARCCFSWRNQRVSGNVTLTWTACRAVPRFLSLDCRWHRPLCLCPLPGFELRCLSFRDNCNYKNKRRVSGANESEFYFARAKSCNHFIRYLNVE